MTAAVSIIRPVSVLTLVPLFTKSFFTIKEDEPVSHLRLFFSTAKHSPDFEQRGDRSCRIVRADKIHVFIKLRIVMAGDQDEFLGFTGDLANDVCHLLFAAWRGSGEFVKRYIDAVRLQLVDDISACFGELWTIGWPWSKIDLFAHVVHRSFAVERGGSDRWQRSSVG